MTQQAQAEALKPCPFCGGAASLKKSNVGEYHSILCTGCTTPFCIVIPNDQIPEGIAGWNRRAQPMPQEPEAVGWFKYDRVSRCWHPQYDHYAPTHAEREGWRQLYLAPAPTAPAQETKPLTDEQIDAVFNLMPDGAQGFLKSWGYRQFARSLLEAAATTVTQPTQNEHANRRLTHMVDAAMTEMANVVPPLRRSECQRLINAAMAAEAAAVEAVKLVIRDYHYGLDTRKNGNLIAGQAVAAIQIALGMEWIQGAEATLRSQTGNT